MSIGAVGVHTSGTSSPGSSTRHPTVRAAHVRGGHGHVLRKDNTARTNPERKAHQGWHTPPAPWPLQTLRFFDALQKITSTSTISSRETIFGFDFSSKFSPANAEDDCESHLRESEKTGVRQSWRMVISRRGHGDDGKALGHWGCGVGWMG